MEHQKITRIDTIVGIELTNQRELLKKTQAEMGKMLGSSATRWAKLEKGSTSMSLSDMYDACEALQIDVKNFLEAVDKIKGQLEDDGWKVTAKLAQDEVDMLQNYATMNATSFAAVPIIAGLLPNSFTAAIVSTLGAVAASYLIKRKNKK